MVLSFMLRSVPALMAQPASAFRSMVVEAGLGGAFGAEERSAYR